NPDFAKYDFASGTITFNDDTTIPVEGVASLGFTDGQVSVDSGARSVLQAASTVTDPSKAYSFAISIGTDVTAEVSLEADAERTTMAQLVKDLRSAMAKTLVSADALRGENVKLPGSSAEQDGDFGVALSQIVSLAQVGGKLTFSAKNSVLGEDGSGGILNTFKIAEAPVKGLTLLVESINGSTVAEDLGLGGSVVTQGDTVDGVRTISAKLTAPNATSERFFVETGEDPTTGDLLTGITATVGIEATSLNFTAALGPFSAKVVNGTAHFGADVGEAAAGTAGFEVGRANEKPAVFQVSLEDGFGGGPANDGRITFKELAELGSAGNELSDLIDFVVNAAVDVSLPVKVLGQNLGPIELQVGNLFNDADLPEERSVHVTYPSLDGLSIGSILNDPQTLIDGLDAVLSNLAYGSFAQAIYGLDLPLIGPALQGIGSFFAQLHDSVIGTLQSLLDDFKTAHPGQEPTSQNIITQGLEYVLNDILHLPGDVYSFIDSIDSPTELGFIWTFKVTLLDTMVNLSADLGIPGLGLKIENGDINLLAEMNVTLGFGYLKDKGFFIYNVGTDGAGTFTSNNDPSDVFTKNLRDIHALEIGVIAYLPTDPAFSASLSLGFLQMTATNGSTLSTMFGGEEYLGTTLSGILYVDIGPQNNSAHLLFSDFSKGPVLRSGIDLNLNLDLALEAGLGVGSTDFSLPSVSAQVYFSYGYHKVFSGGSGADPVSGIVIPLTFADVTLDAGDFISKILKPILKEVQTVIDPIQPFLDFVSDPIPGLSDIIGDTSLLDLALEYGPPDVKTAATFIQVLDQIGKLARTINAMGGDRVLINFGTFVLGATDNPDFKSISNTNLDPFAKSVANANIDDAVEYYKNNPEAGQAAVDGALTRLNSATGLNIKADIQSVQNTPGRGGKPVIEFPILSDPMAAISLLMGKVTPVDLVHVTLPEFKLSLHQQLDFNFVVVVVPVTVSVYFDVSVAINLAFGYDTNGIIKFLDTPDNPLLLLDGFYVDNTLGPQLEFKFAVGVKAEVSLVLAAAGVGAEINGVIDFKFRDPNNDGKLYASELLTSLLDNPLHLFDIAGELGLRIYAYAWVGIGVGSFKITIIDVSFDIINVTLLTFSYSYADEHSTPQVATLNDDGSLMLNMGKNADRQEVGSNIANPDQTYVITHLGGTAGNETVSVSAGGTTTVYTGVREVVADVGSGDNTVRFENGYQGNVTITGGSGNNTIDLGGVDGDPLIQLGDGDNLIYGASTDTTIITGHGNNTIFGGNARNTITAGNGKNTITGGTQQDTITVGSGNNTIWGNEGDDVIVARGGDNTIWGGTGSNIISISGGAGQNIIFGHGANTAADTTSTTITATTVSANTVDADDVSSTITGGNGRDFIFGGGGDNTISTGAGADVVFGALGEIQRTGPGQIQRISATSSEGGNNVITGGAGDKVLIGGGGHNTITGGAGNDIILGGGGTIDGEAGGSGGRYTVSGLAIGESATIAGGVGNDLIIGVASTNVITGAEGGDIIAGHAAIVVRDQAIGREALLISAETSIEATGGNNTISANGGNDIIFGGAGSHTLDGGTGSDVIIGHFGKITATNIVTGQNFVIEGRNGAATGNGNNVITAAHSAVIMGGGGNNTITTTEATAPADPVNNLPEVTSADRQMLVFGANGTANVDILTLGGIKIHQARTMAGEENAAGDNTINLGAGNNIVFGGAGNNHITTGNGNVIILGHTGAVDMDRLAVAPNLFGRAPDVLGFVLGQDGSTLRGTSSVITAGNGNNVILGGVGDNTITSGTGNNIVFGAAGSVTRNGLASNALIFAETLEESLAGDNTITVGLGARGANVVFGGAGDNRIAVGNGTNVVLGHLGIVNYAAFTLYTDAQRSDGARPDIIARTVPERGRIDGSGPWPTSTLDQPITSTSATIIAGNGNNVILGGAGDNTITAGNGNNTIFGAAGAVTRYAVNKQVSFATTMEESLGGNHVIRAGNGLNLVFGGAGYNEITVGNRNNIIFGHLGQVNYGVLTNFTTEERASGQHPDLVGRVLPALGNMQPRTTAPFAGLDQPLPVAGGIIHAEGGNNIIFGGAGDNTIVAGIGSNTIFGAGGAVTRDTRASSILFAETVEETQGGNNTIYAGLRTIAAQVIFGGPGYNEIVVGDGANVVLGHLGYVDFGSFLYYSSQDRMDGSHPDIVARVVPERGNIYPLTRGGGDGLDEAPTRGGSTIVAGSGNNIIMGGAGDNRIYTGFGDNVVFGAAGAVTRDAATLRLLMATTVEETQGGNNFLELSPGGSGNHVAFGGPGDNIIVSGFGNDIILGHIGTVMGNAVATPAAGLTPIVAGDQVTVVGRILPLLGNVMPVTTAPFAGLGLPLSTAGALIDAGEGHNLVMGGAGANSVTAGEGDNIIFAGAGSVQLDRAGMLLSANALEVERSVSADVILGGGMNAVFNPGPPGLSRMAAFSAESTGVFLVAGSETLSSGSSLSDLAAATQLRNQAWADQSQAPTQGRGAGDQAAAAFSAVGGYVLDEQSGRWVLDEDLGETMLLILSAGTAPELVISAGRTDPRPPRPRLAA
ncbi:MAG: hypothetical protein WCP77_01720, partial [Roseococcus sp.]